MQTFYFHYIGVVFVISNMHYSSLLETSTLAVTTSSHIGTKTGLPTTNLTSNITTSPPGVDAKLQIARAMVMQEVQEGVKIKTRFENLKQNITVRLTALRSELDKRYNNSRTKLNATKAALERSFESVAIDIGHLKYNLSELRETDFTRAEKVVKSMKEDLQKVQQATGTKPGFTIVSPESGQRTTAKFNTVISNIGKELNISGSQFVCEQPGLYVFSLILYKTGFGNSVICHIRVNGKDKIQAYLNPNIQVDYGFYSSGNSVLLRLAKDDIVDVGDCSDLRLLNPLNHRTVFTGFLLKAEL